MQPLEGAHASLFNKKITPILQYDLIQTHQETGARRNFSSFQGQLQQGKRTHNVYKFPICFFACKSFLLAFLFLENMEVVVRCPQGFYLFQETKVVGIPGSSPLECAPGCAILRDLVTEGTASPLLSAPNLRDPQGSLGDQRISPSSRGMEQCADHRDTICHCI